MAWITGPWVTKKGFKVGAKHSGGEKWVADEDGALYQKGAAITATAEQLNSIAPLTMTVANKTSGTLAKGTLVYVNGYDTTLGAPTVAVAGLTQQATHVLTGAILDGATGIADCEALVDGLDTDAFTDVGYPVYLAAAGGISDSAATGAAQDSQIVGRVVTKDAVTGSILFFPGAGLFVKRGTGSLQALAITTGLLASNVLSADAAGRGKMQDGYLDATTLVAKIAAAAFAASADARALFATDFFDAATLADKVADEAFAAASTARALFATDFFTNDVVAKFADGLFAADAPSRAKFVDGIWTAAKLAAGSAIPTKLGIEVINKSGFAIEADKLVAISGLDATSGKPKIVLADTDVAAHEDVYVTTAVIDSDAEGVVVKSALSAADINTDGASSAGDPVYLSTTAGGFVHTAPATSVDRVHPVGMVVVKDTTVGQILWLIGPVRKVGSNEIQDGILSADSAGRGKMAADFFDEATFTAKSEAGAVVDNRLASYLLKDVGRIAKGAVLFAAAGDCTSVDVGAVSYVRSATPTVADGEWTEGANENDSATNLAAGINGDERNGGGPYYSAVREGARVFIYALAVGAAGNVAVARTGGAQPATAENLTGGADAAVKRTAVVTRTVTTIESTLPMQIALPFAPSLWTLMVRDANGDHKYITDRITLVAAASGVPDLLNIASEGAVHVGDTDVITVLIQE